MKILILRFSSIGDIVLTTPVIRNLKKQLPAAEIHYCTKEKFKSILEPNPYIDKLHVLRNNLPELIKELKKENFDIVIDLHKNLRTLRIKLSLGKKSYSFRKLNFEKWLLVNFKIDKLPRVHIVDRYMETVKALGVTNDQTGLDYFIDAGNKVPFETLPTTHRGAFAAIAIGAQHATKKLPKEKIAELCRQLTIPIILLGDEKDKITGDWIESQHKGPSPLYNACGQYTLNQSADIVQKAAFVISHDTGLMHIASALKKPVVSIWGNTVPEFGMYPYLTAHTIIENKGLSCRPCSKIGYKECPKGHFKCMNELTFRDLQLPTSFQKV